MAAYFDDFPLVNYNGYLQTNLTRRVDLLKTMRENKKFYIEHNIKENDTPELLADRFYDSANLAWVILMFNRITNIFEEWPKGSYELESYIISKYENPNAVRHYTLPSDNVILDPEVYPDYDLIPVTFYEYEIEQNDKKREIKLILPEYVDSVSREHKRLMRI